MYGKTEKRKIRTTIEEVVAEERDVEIEIPVYVCSACPAQADASDMKISQRSSPTGGYETYVSSWRSPAGWMSGRLCTGTVEVGDELTLCADCLAKALAAVGLR